jgi:hypothetical protein
MDYVLILILKYYQNVAVSQHTYNSQAACEYARAQTESLATNYLSVSTICVKE